MFELRCMLCDTVIMIGENPDALKDMGCCTTCAESCGEDIAKASLKVSPLPDDSPLVKTTSAAPGASVEETPATPAPTGPLAFIPLSCEFLELASGQFCRIVCMPMFGLEIGKKYVLIPEENVE